MKKLCILGSTGSIGTSTLKVVDHHPENFSVEALAAHSNITLLEEQAKRYKPKFIAVYDEEKARQLQKRLPHQEILAGKEGLIQVAACSSVDLVVSAIVGTAGLEPTVAAIKARKELALANKEVIVSAGEYVMSLAKEHEVLIRPVDSEHCAIWQCLRSGERQEVQRLILTASGGPFREYSLQQLREVTKEQALKHPTWMMGAKITTDCSTLMNKGLEVIEARWLFDVPVEQIDVVIHPQSLIHSMVEFVDGSLLAEINETDMVLAIQHALSYPKRLPGLLKPFDFTKFHTLQFFTPDQEKFRCLRLAYDALKEGGDLPCYMNAANEVLVERFLKEEISWLSIGEKLETLMGSHDVQKASTLEEILETERKAKQEAMCA